MKASFKQNGKGPAHSTEPCIPIRLFQFGFFCCFAFILLSVVFNRAVYNYSTVMLCLVLSAAFFGIFIFGRVVRRYQKLFSDNYRSILTVSAALLLILQIIIGNQLRFSPIFDLEAVYRGGIEWATTGSFGSYYSSTCYKDYFYIFPNNLGTLSFFAMIFKAATVIGVDYFTMAMLVNAVMATFTMVLTSLICNRLFGYTGGLTAIMLFLISPPFYFIAPVFYTDSLSLIFPVSACQLMIVSRNKRLSAQIPLVFAALLIIAIGTLIKPTVSVFAIAVAIVLAVKKHFRQLLLYAVSFSVITAIVLTGFNMYIYSAHLDKSIADNKNTPITYWLNLAVHSNGRYNNEIFALSQIENPEQRNQALSDELKACINEKSLLDWFSLVETKSTIAFGDGTYAQSDFLDDNPLNYGFLQSTLLYSSENYYTYSTACTGIFAAILLLMLLSSSRRQNDSFTLISQISVFGIWLFLMLWEINSRYITTFIPFIFICAVAGTERLHRIFPISKQ